MQYNSWLEAPFSGSFTVISDSNYNNAIGQTFKYTELFLRHNKQYTQIEKDEFSLIFFIKDVEFDFIEIINNTNLNKIIHEL